MRTISCFVRQPGFILAVINFCLGLVWMAVIRPLDAPDEPGHLQAIMQVRKQHILPEMHLQPAVNTAREVIWPPRDPETVAYIRKVRQELPVNDHYLVIPYKSVQPPLYYVIAGLVAHVAPPEPKTVLYIGRLVSVLFGAATVYFCWLTIRKLVPDAPVLAVAAAGVTALLPQFCFTNAHAANDSAVNLAATAGFYIWVRALADPEFDGRLFGAGAMLGFAILSKLTAIVLIPGLVLVILFRMFQARPSVLGLANWLKRGLGMIAGATLGVVLVCGWWFVRNLVTYGEPSGTKAELHVVAGNFIKADFSKPQTAGDLAHYTLENLWGRFGWNDITLPHGIYHFCNTAALVLVCLSGNRCVCAMGYTKTPIQRDDVASRFNLPRDRGGITRRFYTIQRKSSLPTSGSLLLSPACARRAAAHRWPPLACGKAGTETGNRRTTPHSIRPFKRVSASSCQTGRPCAWWRSA